MNRRNNTNLYLSIILIAVVLFSLMTIYASSTSAVKRGIAHISADAATLYEPETESFLYTKNAFARMPMASTTKIMTAIVALENSCLDEMVEIADCAIGTEGSSAYLKSGDVLTMEELLYALLLQSANDAAVAIACYIAGDVEAFAGMMNEKAAALGLADTHFTNPHGLDDPEHYTSAHDLALIAADALKNDTFKKISSTYKKSFVTEERSRTYVNHNKLLRTYDGSIGMKTGFTRKSGRCLVGAAEREGLTFITVTLDAPDDWNDHKLMLDYGYDTLEKITLAKPLAYSYNIKVLDGNEESVRVSNTDAASIILPRGDHISNEYVKLSRFVTAPINEGDILGEVIFTVDGDQVGSVHLIAERTINIKEEKGFFKKLLGWGFLWKK